MAIVEYLYLNPYPTGINHAKSAQIDTYGAIICFGLSLLIPGIVEMLSLELVTSDVESISQTNQRRALHGMMAGLGLLSCMACFRLAQARVLVMGIGFTLVLVVTGRLYSLIIDGMPDKATLFYLVIETLLALIFLLLPSTGTAKRECVSD
ncbi:MAG: DUF4345 domain-containing protein [Candidatus Thiodiazotropha sp. (ex Lucinoma borealis)]|nr:DUF4345 domain-containing protein [Candidatus Thiodiazotropha sp. (ex Lucinoma borealis)]